MDHNGGDLSHNQQGGGGGPFAKRHSANTHSHNGTNTNSSNSNAFFQRGPPSRCLLPPDSVGYIVGKSGQHIRQITDDSGASIDVSRDAEAPPDLSDKIVTINGTPHAKESAVGALLRRLRQINKQTMQERGVFVIIIPDKSAPAIIGQRGNTINELCKSTECEIHISKDSISGMIERPVTLSGSVNAIMNAISSINEIIADMVNNGKLGPGDFQLPSSQQQQQPQQQPQRRNNNNGSHARQSPSYDRSPANSNHSSSPAGTLYAGTSTTAYGRPGGSDMGATSSVGAGGGGGGGSGGSSDAPSKVTLKLITTTQLAGWIVGRGGVHVKELQSKTGATVYIDNDTAGHHPLLAGQERLIIIQGSIMSKRNALRILITQLETRAEGSVCRMVIPASTVKELIGRQGQRIDGMVRQSGCQIHVQKEVPNGCEERPVNITGAFENKLHAAQLLHHRLEEIDDPEGAARVPLAPLYGGGANIRSASDQVMDDGFDYRAANNMSTSSGGGQGGGVVLEPAPRSTYQQQQHHDGPSGAGGKGGAHITPVKTYEGSVGVGVGVGVGGAVGGPPTNGGHCNGSGSAATSTSEQSQTSEGRFFTNMMAHTSMRVLTTPQTFNVEISLPKSQVDFLCSGRGYAMNNISDRSGCVIAVGYDVPNQQNRTVTLTGTPLANATALLLIQEKLMELR
ncbi:unnamed protein product [Vitrella brassicaformis CCMP3155]|uniref:K Homology domain-containing protein n=2 Tax=Vitrella brassicaformis TaxID=1169539 RepID=A0A0G4F5M6_VITBC|nr:unnamed protein product [Vitrella brassicaformis CCMP3155]|eukprot:CEM07431.1 unnamed protein product [Vitrella brassicaformis CCMP3155]